MTIKFRCECGRKLKVDNRFSGSKGKCPECGRVVEVPQVTFDNDASVSKEENVEGATLNQPAMTDAVQVGTKNGSDTPSQSVVEANEITQVEQDNLPSFDEIGGRFNLPDLGSGQSSSGTDMFTASSGRKIITPPSAPRMMSFGSIGKRPGFSWLGLSPRKRGFHIAAGVLFCIYALFNIFGGFSAFSKGNWEKFKTDTSAGLKEGITDFMRGFGGYNDPEVMRFRTEARREKLRGNVRRITFYIFGTLFIALAGLNVTSGVGLFASSSWAAKLTFITATSGVCLDVVYNIVSGINPLIILYLAINGFAIFACIDR